MMTAITTAKAPAKTAMMRAARLHAPNERLVIEDIQGIPRRFWGLLLGPARTS